MGRYAKSSGGEFQQCPAGTHVARCIKLIDLGTQHGEYQGKPTRREQIVVQWEVPGETIDTESGPQPMIVSKFYTNSLGEKANLRGDLETWRGLQFTPDELAGFDLMKILNAPALINVIHNEHGAFAGGQRTTDFVGEINVSGSVDKIELVGFPVFSLI